LLATVPLLEFPSPANADLGPRFAGGMANQPQQARVAKRYGAAIWEDVLPDSPMLATAECNEALLVVGYSGPWFQVFRVVGQPDELSGEDDDLFGWIAAEHLVVGSPAPSVECSSAPGHRVGITVESFVWFGCLNLYAQPTGASPIQECRPDGERYQIVNGPMQEGGQEWFELRPSSGGPGWAQANVLFPVP